MNDVEVLLVEDSADEAKLTMRALMKNKVTKNVIWVKNGEEAQDFLLGQNEYSQRDARNKPKVILLDLKLPKVTGIDFLKILKSNEDTRCIPVVILTASAEDKDLRECYAHGVNSYIVKPTHFEYFTDLLNDIGRYWVFVNTSPIN